jgi:hypothetical protein
MSARRFGRIAFGKIFVADPEVGRLASWSYARSIVDRGRAMVESSHVAIATRPGHPGLWVCKPYFAYAGKRRFRRLPVRLAFVVRILAATGLARNAVDRASRGIAWAWRLHGPSAQIRWLRQRRAEARFRREWGL